MSLLYDRIKPQTHKKMVTNLNALSFGSVASSMGNMPVGIPMALARVPVVELFHVVGY